MTSVEFQNVLSQITDPESMSKTIKEINDYYDFLAIAHNVSNRSISLNDKFNYLATCEKLILRGKFECEDLGINDEEGPFKDVPLSDITSLKFLKYCYNLKELIIGETYIKDLVGLENCSKLEYLECEINNLKTLKGIENCKNLKTLICSSNNLKSLSGIENCTKLEKLDCAGNPLKTWNELKFCVNLTYLGCQQTGINTLDYLKNCTKLEYLNITGNYNLSSFSGLENCLELNELQYNLHNLKFNLDDLKNCTKLTKINCN